MLLNSARIALGCIIPSLPALVLDGAAASLYMVIDDRNVMFDRPKRICGYRKVPRVGLGSRDDIGASKFDFLHDRRSGTDRWRRVGQNGHAALDAQLSEPTCRRGKRLLSR